MDAVFSKVLNMSLTASVVIVVVLAIRLFLRKAPTVISYALWAVVLFRLLCPVSLTAPVSLLEVTQPRVTVQTERTSQISYLPERIPAVPPAEAAVEIKQGNPAPIPPAAAESKPGFLWDWMEVFSWIWLTGIAVMGMHSVVSYKKLRRCLSEASWMDSNVYQADGIPTPFVIGLVKPKIFLPSDTPLQEHGYILAHERHHIQRGDHWIKVLAYAALCVHWFNPLVWAAFFLAGKDMEMSCDEAVIRKLGPQIRADYAQTLLRMATHRQVIGGIPLAFGEGDTKSRVKNMVNWKQPKTWVVLVSILLCTLAAVGCAVNPGENEQPEETIGMKLPRNISALEFVNGDWKFFATEPMEDEPGDVQIISTSVLGGIRVHGTQNQALVNPETWAQEQSWEDAEQSTVTLDGVTLDTPYGDYEVRTENILRYFYESGDKTYEVWFDTALVKEETRNAILQSVYFAPNAAIEANLTEVTIDLPSQISMGLKLPVDMKDVQTGQEIQFCPVDYEHGGTSSNPWGGMRTYPAPADSWRASSMEEWLQELKVPQIADGLHDYMACSTLDGTLEVSFTDAGGRETDHYYFTQGDTVFELWFDPYALDDMTRAAILESVTFAPNARIERSLPMVQAGIWDNVAADAEQSDETDYLEKCRTALKQLQGEESYSLQILNSNHGDIFLNNTSTTFYHQDGKDWLLVHKVPEDGFVHGVNQFGYMEVAGTYYNNDGHGMDENEEINWVRDSADKSVLPWIRTFDWDAQDVLYVSKIPAGKGMCITLQVMAPYHSEDSSTLKQYPFYQTQFVFRENGEFDRIENTIYYHDLIQDKDCSTKEIIQVVQDQAKIAIAYEYQRYLDAQ